MTNDELFKRFLDKKVFIKLKSNRVYSGTVKEVSDQDNGLVFISIVDKFGKDVTFANGEVEVVEEFRE